jgi:hypothetical protein
LNFFLGEKIAMRKKAALVVAGAIFAVGALVSMSKAPEGLHDAPAGAPSESTSSSKVADAYEKWRAAHEENGGDRNVELALRWHKALSREPTIARGTARLDLVEGRITVDLEGLTELGAVDVWFVHNVEGEGRSVKPEPGDRFLYAGAMQSDASGRGALNSFIGAELREFEIDLVMVTRKDASPTEAGILFGSLPLFQRLYSLERIRKIRS